MARAIAEINVTGLAELRRALRKVDASILPELREGLKGAADIVVRDVKAQVPRRTGRAAASVRSVSSGNTIYIKAGGARVPYFGWLEFGGQLPGHHYRSRKAMWWPGADHPIAHARGAYRPKVPDGRYIRPTIARRTNDIVDAAGDAFDSAARKAGLK